MSGRDKINLGDLAILEALTPPGCTWSQPELADILGVSAAAIHYIETRAKKRIRNRLWSDYLAHHGITPTAP